MFLRRCFRTTNGKRYAYWALVESYRTERGPRQRVVARLGELDERERRALTHATANPPPPAPASLFASAPEAEAPDWVRVDAQRVRVERPRDFGAAWLALQVAERLQLPQFFAQHLPAGREEVPWAAMALLLAITRFCTPSSELAMAEGGYAATALPELLGVPADKVNDDRLYRTLDWLLPLKDPLERHLHRRLGELFQLEYDLLLYDVTSTYFEGLVAGNAQACRGYSRDHRPDCKQVCIALVVSREGLPLGYQVFAGNRADVTTVEQIVHLIERRYGRAERIWVMDRGMVSEDNLQFLRAEGRRYILGTPRQQLRKFEQELLEADWRTIRGGLEVKLCPGPDEQETFVLCRSADRREKEHAMHARFEQRIETGLQALATGQGRRPLTAGELERRVGKLLGANTRAAGLFDVCVATDADGQTTLTWSKRERWREWAELSEGCYLLRTNIHDWKAEQLWEAYTQLTQVEAAFRIHKSDLVLRPVWHQLEERVQAHILVCFLAYVLWKTLGQLCRGGGLGDCPRQVLSELAKIRMVDVILPTDAGVELRKRCVTQPEPHQAILLQRLGLRLPRSLPTHDV